MTKRKKSDEDKTPAERPMAIDKSATLARAMTIEQSEPISFEFAVCPVCGSRQATEICPVDGHRFEGVPFSEAKP